MKKLNTAIALALGIASTSVLAQETAFSANTSANASTSASLSITNGANSQSATQANTQTPKIQLTLADNFRQASQVMTYLPFRD